MAPARRRRRICRPGAFASPPERPRVLVESPDAWAFVDGLEAAGYEVATCRGPSDDERCLLLASGACPAATEADLIVSALRAADGAADVVAGLATVYPETPVVVEAERPGAALYDVAGRALDASLALPER